MNQHPLAAAPDASEFAPYAAHYVSLVNGTDILSALERQADEVKTVFTGLSEEEALYRPSPDKWSVKEILGHITDTERIFAYRALRFARNDKTQLEGFEQDDYVRAARFDDKRVSDLVDDFIAARKATLSLMRSFVPEAWVRRGVANGAGISVRALAYMMAGHVTHHLHIVRDRYLAAGQGSQSQPA
jgi:DinB family protein